MESIVIFGIGSNFLQVQEELKNKYKIVALIDNKVEKIVHGGDIPIVEPEKVLDMEYDKILILPYRTKFRREMYLQLRSYGVQSEKIFPYYAECLLPKEHIRNDYKLQFSLDGYVTLIMDDIKVKVYTETDEWVLREVFFNETYGFNVGEDDLTVIDIGMNVGMASLFFAKYPQVKDIYSFEPFPQTYRIAKTNIELNCPGIGDKIHTYNFGLSNCEMEKSFAYQQDNPGGMRIVEGAKHLSEEMGGTTIKTKVASSVIDDILTSHPGRRCLMKIDCEGSEYPIFENLDREDMLDKIDYIILETHSGCSCNVKDIERYLKKNKFEYFSTHVANAIYQIRAIKIV